MHNIFNDLKIRFRLLADKEKSRASGKNILSPPNNWSVPFRSRVVIRFNLLIETKDGRRESSSNSLDRVAIITNRRNKSGSKGEEKLGARFNY